MDPSKLVQETITSLTKFQDEERQSLAPWYYPTSLEVIGLKTADLRIVLKQLKDILKNTGEQEYLELCHLLVGTKIFECRQLAYELLDKRRTLTGKLKKKDILKLAKGNDNWVSVDTFSVMVAGISWREGGIDDEVIMEWLKSDDRWVRRTAVVSTIALNQKSRGGKGDVDRTLKVCEQVVDDRDDMVQKAVSWALRELSKKEKGPVEGFLQKHRDRLSGRVKREVMRKLATGKKN